MSQMDFFRKLIFRFLRLSAVVLLLVFSSASIYAQLGSFSGRRVITNLLGNSLRPQSVGVGNTIYLTFMHLEGTGKRQVYFMKSTDAGATFSTPVVVTTGNWDHNYPAIAATADGKVFIAWQDQRDGLDQNGFGDIFLIRSTDSGNTFGPELRMTPADTRLSRLPSLAVEGNNNVYLTWFDVDPTLVVQAIFFRKSNDGGLTWTPDPTTTAKIVTANDSFVDNEHPHIVKDGTGKLHIIFRSTREGDPIGGWPPFDIFHYLSLDDGTTWVHPAGAISPTLPADIATCFGARIAISDNGALHASWWEEQSGMNVFYRRSSDFGYSWGPIVKLSNYDFSMKEPNPNVAGGLQGDTTIITDDQNRVYVFWHGFEATSPSGISLGKIQGRRSIDNGVTFQPIENLDTTVASASNLDLARTTTKIHMFYEGHNNSGGTSDEIEYRYVSTVNNQPPHGTITSPSSSPLKIKPNVNFTFQGSGTDPDGTISSYFWDWGGATTNSTTGPGGTSSVVVSFPSYGNFTVRFIPIDNLLERDPNPATLQLIVADLSDNVFFVRQLYSDFVNRLPDAPGLNFWVGQLNSGAMSRAQVTFEFFKSQEFQGNGAYIARLYSGILFRRTEYDGFIYWLNELNSGRRTRLEIISAFIASPEFQFRFGGSLTNREFVRRLYLNILFREPDQAGSDFWTSQLDSGAMSRAQVTQSFIESPEYVQITETSIFVQLEYIGLLRRAAEDSGFNFWVDQFNMGRSKLDLINLFINSFEYQFRFGNP